MKHALEKIQQTMTKDNLWLLSHNELNFNVVIRQQKDLTTLLAVIKKVMRIELGGAVQFVSVSPTQLKSTFKIVLMLKRKPITIMVSLIRIYEQI